MISGVDDVVVEDSVLVNVGKSIVDVVWVVESAVVDVNVVESVVDVASSVVVEVVVVVEKGSITVMVVLKTLIHESYG